MNRTKIVKLSLFQTFQNFCACIFEEFDKYYSITLLVYLYSLFVAYTFITHFNEYYFHIQHSLK